MNLGMEKCKRIMQRLAEHRRFKVTEFEVKRAIMRECGIHNSTIRAYKKALITVGWLTRKKTHWIITGAHETEDFL
jgi:uncharacterized protein (UPF0179 family)